jgi:predicted TIM-barrel fold metal-dependent hydrolase
MEELESSGVERAVIVGQRGADRWGNVDNADIAALVAAYPSKFVGFAGIDAMDASPVERAEVAIEDQGLSGLALIPGWADPPVKDDAERLDDLYAWCQRRSVPVIITSSHFIGPDMLHAHPVHLQRVALKYPDLTMIIGHAAWPWTTAACSLAMRCTNVYLMPEFYMYLPHMPGAKDYVDAANGYLSHRMLFSSCYPSNSISQALAYFDALPLLPRSRELVLHENGDRLLDQLTNV